MHVRRVLQALTSMRKALASKEQRLRHSHALLRRCIPSRDPEARTLPQTPALTPRAPPSPHHSDPIKRMLSHLKFIVMQMKWDYRDNDLFHRTFTGTDAAFWEQWGPVLVDNYMLR